MRSIYKLFLLASLLLISCVSKRDEATINENKYIVEEFPVIKTFKEQGIHLINGQNSSFSKLGGLPAMPISETWPRWKDKPLSFIGQIKLSELPKNNSGIGPSNGLLFIFYDQDQSTWGFDPNDKGSWKIIYIEDEETPVEQLSAPLGLDVVYKEKKLAGKIIDTYPSWDNEKIRALNLSDGQFEKYMEFRAADYTGSPEHLLFGIPTPIQNEDMDYQCELVTNGLYCGDSTGYNDPKAKLLKRNKDEWILLFQIDTDDESEMMWGDAGMLYFWIKKRDLKNNKYDTVWMILQCG